MNRATTVQSNHGVAKQMIRARGFLSMAENVYEKKHRGMSRTMSRWVIGLVVAFLMPVSAFAQGFVNVEVYKGGIPFDIETDELQNGLVLDFGYVIQGSLVSDSDSSTGNTKTFKFEEFNIPPPNPGDFLAVIDLKVTDETILRWEEGAQTSTDEEYRVNVDEGDNKNIRLYLDDVIDDDNPVTVWDMPLANIPGGSESAWGPSGSVGGVVRLHSGEFTEHVVDFAVPGVGLDMVFGRRFLGNGTPDTLIGNRWDFSHNISVDEVSDVGLPPEITVRLGNGREVAFSLEGTLGGVYGGPGLGIAFPYTADGWPCVFGLGAGPDFLRWEDGTTWIFDDIQSDTTPLGVQKLKTIRDRNGNEVTIEYDATSDLISKITDSLGREYEFGYNAGLNRLVSIREMGGQVSDQREVVYEYYDFSPPDDDQDGFPDGTVGELSKGLYKNGDGTIEREIKYTYVVNGIDVPGAPAGTFQPVGALRSITDAKGRVLVKNTYNAAGQVVEQEFEDSNVNITYAYQDFGGPFPLGGLGPATPTLVDAHSQTVVVDPERLVTQYLFDEQKRMVFSRRFTDVAGPTWVFDPNNPNTFNLLDEGVRGANEADSYTTKYAWNDQDDLIETLDSGLVHTVFGYAANVDIDPRQRGHVTTTDVYDTAGANPIRTVNRYKQDNSPTDQSITGLHLVEHEDVYELGGNVLTTTYEYDDSANITKVTYPDSTADIFTYNTKGLVEMATTPDTVIDETGAEGNSRTDTFTYDFTLADNAYKVDTVQDSTGAQITSTDTYNPRGLLVSSIDPKENETTFSYTYLDMLEKSTQPVAGNGSRAAPSTRYTYDQNNNIDTIAVAHYDVDGRAKLPIVTKYEYDAMDRVQRIINDANGLGATTEFEYDFNGRVTKTLSPEAVAGSQPLNYVETKYDERGFVFETWRANDDANSKTTFNYDGWGNVTEQELPDGENLLFTFDDWGRPKSSTNQEDVFTLAVQRNLRGLVEIESIYTDSSLLTRLSTTVNTFDSLGRLTHTKLNNDNTGTTFDYTDAGQLWQTIDPAGRANTVAFDSMHRMAGSRDGQGNEAAFTYDENSNVISVVQTDENETGGSETLTTTFAYDNLNRRISTMDIAQNEVFAKYDSLDRLCWTQDAMGNTNKITFDNLGRKIGAARMAPGTQNATATTAQSYDLNGRLTGQTDPKGYETKYQYDAFDRQTMMQYADGSTLEVTGYDDHYLRPKTVRKPDGTVVTNAYDQVGRLTARNTVAPTGVLATNESFTHDALGRVTSEAVTAGTDTIATSIGYDYVDFPGFPQVEKEITLITPSGTYAQTITTDYEHTGLATGKTFNNRNLGYTHNDAGQPSTMTVDGSTVADLKYVGGRRAEKTIGGEVTADYSYDTADDGYKVTGITHTDDSSGVTLDDRTNQWDDNYNRTERKLFVAPNATPATPITHTYGYDELDRMNEGSSTTNYTLDAAGNRTDASYALTGTGEKLHQYASTPSGDFGYDAAGRLSDLTTANRSYKYDALGRLKELVNSATGLVPGNTAFLNQSTTVSGTWIEENDYIRESSAGAGRLIWTSAPVDLTKLELKFWREDSAPPPPPEPYGPEHYGLVLLRVTQYTAAPDTDEWRFLALTIQPDGVFLREWDKDVVTELGGVEVDVAEDVWHDVTIEINDDDITVKLDLDGATDVETIEATTSIPACGDAGLGVGASAEFRFKDMGSDKPVAGSVALRYHYDTAGRVVGRTLDPGGANVSQYFIYDDDRIKLELDGSGNVVAEWVYGVYIDEIIAMYRNTDGQPGLETHYYIQDDLYNVVALTDENGDVIERYAYDDYGAPTFYDGAGNVITETAYGNYFLFNGRRWDEALELYDYRTRYYDPASGRFLRIDTIGPWGDNNNLGNAYAYVGNNPWTLLDPYGEDIYDFLDNPNAEVPGTLGGGRLREAAITHRGLNRMIVAGRGAEAFVSFTREDLHTALEGLGMVPGVGIVFDVTNGVVYFVERKPGQAGWSFLGAVPLAGDAVSAVRNSGRLVTEIPNIARSGSRGVAVVVDNQDEAAELLQQVAQKGGRAANTPNLRIFSKTRPQLADHLTRSRAKGKKNVPNPGGKLGNAATRAKTREVSEDLEARGFKRIRTEVQFEAGSLGSGKNRYADVVGINPKTGQSEIVQIGNTLKSDARVPVMRERRALDDIVVSPTIKEKFSNSTIRYVDVNRPGVVQP